MKVVIGDAKYDVEPGDDTITVGGESYALRVVRAGNIVTVYVNEKPFAVQLPSAMPDDGPVKVLVDAKEYAAEIRGSTGARSRPKPKPKKTSTGGSGAVASQMTGRVIRVDVKPGDVVKEGDVLLVIEAMKMENEIRAPQTGIVGRIHVQAGQAVEKGAHLVTLAPPAAS